MGDGRGLDGGLSEITRRALVRRGGAFGLVAVGGSWAMACGGGGSEKDDTSTDARAEQGKPRTGGTLRLGLTSAGELESFDPALGLASVTTAQLQRLPYDFLVQNDDNWQPQPMLATRFEANEDASEYLIEIRDGVTWHDGSPFTTDDVIYSLRAAQNPKSYSAALVAVIDGKRIKKDGAGKIRVPLVRPFANLPSAFSSPGLNMIKDGTTKFGKPIGTGAFKVESTTPGRQTVFTRNDDYWGQKPYLDGIDTRSFADPSAMVNAVLGGQLDAAANVVFQDAREHESRNDVQVLHSGANQPFAFYMRTDSGPFADVRVRQAMRLIADRKALVNGVMAGYGAVGNDLMGMTLPFYAKSLPQREQDIEQARSLLRQAGASDLRFEIEAGDAFPGFVSAATLLAEQCKAAGVTASVKRVPADTYFNPSLTYLTRPIGLTVWPLSTLAGIYDQTVRSDAPANETHFKDKSYDAKLDAAEAAVDESDATQKWLDVQKTQYDQGGYLVFAGYSQVMVASNKLKGAAMTNLPWTVAPILQKSWLAA